MNLTRELRLQGLSHEEIFVRSRMLEILAKDKDPGIDVTTQAIAQIDLHGGEGAFEYFYHVTSLALDKKSIEWVLEKTTSATVDGTLDPISVRLIFWLQTAPLHLISENREAFEKRLWLLSHSPAESQLPGSPLSIVYERLEWESMTDSNCLACLDEIIDECLESEDFPHTPLKRAKYLCQRLARDGGAEGLREKVVGWLGAANIETEGKVDWQAGIAIQLAGLLKMTETVPALIRMFDKDWDWWDESIPNALNAMGDEKILEIVLENFPKLEWTAKLFLTEVMEVNRWPGKDNAIAALLEKEVDEIIRLNIGIALAVYGTPSSMTKAWEVFNENPKNADYFLIAEILYASNRLLGTGNPPEMERWKSRMEENLLRKKTGLPETDGHLWDEKSIWPELGLSTGFEIPPFPTMPMTNPNRNIGRNDPCPCGSGKKYKKCCLP